MNNKQTKTETSESGYSSLEKSAHIYIKQLEARVSELRKESDELKRRNSNMNKKLYELWTSNVKGEK